MKNIERTSTLIGFTYTSADVRVQARRQDSPPQFVEVEYDVRIVTDEPERRVDLLHRNLRQFGTVYNTLAAVCDARHGRRSHSGGVITAPAQPLVRNRCLPSCDRGLTVQVWLNQRGLNRRRCRRCFAEDVQPPRPGHTSRQRQPDAMTTAGSSNE